MIPEFLACFQAKADQFEWGEMLTINGSQNNKCNYLPWHINQPMIVEPKIAIYYIIAYANLYMQIFTPKSTLIWLDITYLYLDQIPMIQLLNVMMGSAFLKP